MILNLFANYRYGVHAEHGYTAEGDAFPYTFLNPRGFKQITGCNNTEIEGSYSNSYDSNRTTQLFFLTNSFFKNV